MKKTKYIILLLIVLLLVIVVPNTANATDGVDVTRTVTSNNGSMSFMFSGLTLDTTHEYQFGLTATTAAEVAEWYTITEYTESTINVAVLSTTDSMREVINLTDTGYITIKDVTTDTIVLEPYAVDLKLPYLQVANFTVIENGTEYEYVEHAFNIGIRNAGNSGAYYQYQQITDENIINRYREIKEENGNVLDMQDMLSQTPPTSNWSTWTYWNGYDYSELNGFGYPERTISVPNTGLYYLWIYFSGENIKDVYGYVLVDNLEEEISVQSVSLRETAVVELGDTLTLEAIINPSTATNKIVTWSSSDESVATVDNAGRVTPVSVGSTVITVTTQDGNFTASCTVTVVAEGEGPTTDDPSDENNNDENNNDNNNNNNNDDGLNSAGKTDPDEDNTTAKGELPYTGITSVISVIAIILIGGGVFAYFKYNRLKGI